MTRAAEAAVRTSCSRSGSATRTRAGPRADASTQCFPHGMPRIMESPYPIEIVQTAGQVTLPARGGPQPAPHLHRPAAAEGPAADLARLFRRPLGRRHPGGRDHHGINDRTVHRRRGLGSSRPASRPPSASARSTAAARIEMVMTIDDPVTLEHPYSYKRYYYWRPDIRPMEYVCEENNRNAPVRRRDGGPMMRRYSPSGRRSALAMAAPAVAAPGAHPTSPACGRSPTYTPALKPVDGKRRAAEAGGQGRPTTSTRRWPPRATAAST